jgi:signal peptidase I
MNIPRALITSRIYTVRGGSMLPALRPGERLLVSASAYSDSSPSRRDVVVVGNPRGADILYFKRVVGLPGEEIALSEGLLYVDGEHLVEPYLDGLPASLGLGESIWRLGEGQYFVLGDRRARSTDSRKFGPVGLDLIHGRAWLRCWPPRRWGRI